MYHQISSMYLWKFSVDKTMLKSVCIPSLPSIPLATLISLINVELGINVEGVQKLPNH